MSMHRTLTAIHMATARTFMVPTFLAPSLMRQPLRSPSLSKFSTSVPRAAVRRERNKKRGVSALRRTGPKNPLSVSNEPLPQPVLDPSRRSKVFVKEDHGLWQFFRNDKKSLATPEKMSEFGRSWTLEELRHKSFEDLHSLWWVCVKERNRISTLDTERERVKAGYGQAEAEERRDEVKRTQIAIKHALTERWYAYSEAKEILQEQSTNARSEEAS